jgi:hypothetical protein
MEVFMSNHSRSSAAIKPREEELVDLETQGEYAAEIIPFPDLSDMEEKKKPVPSRPLRLEGKYLYCKGKKISILHFQKSGYEKLLKLLVKEMGD